MRDSLRAWLLCGGLALALPAHAGLFDDEEARMQISKLRTQLETLRTKVDALNNNQVDFAGQIEALRGDIAGLRGQIEVLAHGIETTQKRQQDFYVDLDNRLRKLEEAAKAAAAQPAPAPEPKLEVTDTAEYEKAIEALKAGRTKEAAAALEQFIVKFPDSPLQPGAHYWAAYANGQLKAVLKAAALLGELATNWPDDERTPEALELRADYLKVAKDLKGSRAALELLARKYPASEQGKRAKQRLAAK